MGVHGWSSATEEAGSDLGCSCVTASAPHPLTPAQICLRPLAMLTAHPGVRRAGDFSG